MLYMLEDILWWCLETLAYIDQISDLPTSPVNAQNIVSNCGT